MSVLPEPETIDEPVVSKLMIPELYVIVIPEPEVSALYSKVVPAPTTPNNELPLPTDDKPVPPFCVGNIPAT
jgi:hypothetical protein